MTSHVMDWIPLVALVTSAAMVAFIVYVITKSREKRLEAQLQMQSRLVERFGTTAELVDFLHSPAGRQFVSGVQSMPRMFARDRIVSAFTRAIILTALGVAFLLIAMLDDSSWYVAAAIVFFLGLGYLIAAIVTWKFAQKYKADETLSDNP